MTEIPSVSFQADVGHALDVFGLNSVGVNYANLVNVLDEFGEFDYDDRTPIRINIVPYVNHYDPMRGLAALSYDSEGQPLLRTVILPLVDLGRPSGLFNKKYTMTLDSKRVNSVLVHELRHVVDYNDQDLVKASQRTKVEVYKENQKQARLMQVGAAAMSLSGAALCAKGLIDHSLVEIAAAELPILASYIPLHLSGQNANAHMTAGPMEKRAYEVQRQLETKDRVPDIVTIN